MRNQELERPDRNSHERAQAQELRKNWRDFMGGLAWEYAFHLTFDPKRESAVPQERAEKQAVWICELLAALSRKHVGWLVATERSKNGRHHAHALVIGAYPPAVRVAMLCWKVRNGFCESKRIPDPQGALDYLTKEAAAAGNIRFSDTLWKYLPQRNQRTPLELVGESEPAAASGAASAAEQVQNPETDDRHRQFLAIVRRDCAPYVVDERDAAVGLGRVRPSPDTQRAPDLAASGHKNVTPEPRCPGCGYGFRRTRRDQEHCSSRCRVAAHRRKKMRLPN